MHCRSPDKASKVQDNIYIATLPELCCVISLEAYSLCGHTSAAQTWKSLDLQNMLDT